MFLDDTRRSAHPAAAPAGCVSPPVPLRSLCRQRRRRAHGQRRGALRLEEVLLAVHPHGCPEPQRNWPLRTPPGATSSRTRSCCSARSPGQADRALADVLLRAAAAARAVRRAAPPPAALRRCRRLCSRRHRLLWRQSRVALLGPGSLVTRLLRVLAAFAAASSWVPPRAAAACARTTLLAWHLKGCVECRSDTARRYAPLSRLGAEFASRLALCVESRIRTVPHRAPAHRPRAPWPPSA